MKLGVLQAESSRRLRWRRGILSLQNDRNNLLTAVRIMDFRLRFMTVSLPLFYYSFVIPEQVKTNSAWRRIIIRSKYTVFIPAVLQIGLAWASWDHTLARYSGKNLPLRLGRVIRRMRSVCKRIRSGILWEYQDSCCTKMFHGLNRVSHLGISPRMAFQGYASGRPRANQN